MCASPHESLITNAVVGAQDEYYCIAVYSGLMLSLIEAAFAILGSDKAFPDIGNSRVAEKHEEVKRAHDLYGEALLQGHGFGQVWRSHLQHTGTTFPVEFFALECPSRFGAAKQLAADMMEFLLLHELGHAALGHVAYEKSAYGAAAISEGAMNAPDVVDEVVAKRRAFEHIADHWALEMLLGCEFQKSVHLSVEESMRVRSCAPFILLYLFVSGWADRFFADVAYPEPFKRMYGLKLQLLSSVPSDLYQAVCQDMVGISRVTRTMNLGQLMGTPTLFYDFIDSYENNLQVADKDLLGADTFRHVDEVYRPVFLRSPV